MLLFRTGNSVPTLIAKLPLPPEPCYHPGSRNPSVRQIALCAPDALFGKPEVVGVIPPRICVGNEEYGGGRMLPQLCDQPVEDSGGIAPDVGFVEVVIDVLKGEGSSFCR